MPDPDWMVIALRLGLATLAGLALGLERQWHGHDAGLRTHALVALSAAMIMLSAVSMADSLIARGANSDPLRVIQGIAQAIGFIAGGLIFIRGGDVRNMTTAASLWMAAAIGIAAGAGQVVLMAIALVIALVVLAALAPIERRMPRHHPTRADGGVEMPNRRGATQMGEGEELPPP